MITTSRQLKDLIRNLSKKNMADAQILMRNYMMERFLERITLSDYKDRFILKGGMLVAAMVGLDARATMDMDATIKGVNVSVEDVEYIISSILSIPLEDGVTFCVKQISEIMEEAEYPGVRVSMETTYDGVRTPLKIDISTGDVITPCEVQYSFKLMLEERFIEVWAYNLETVLAEKMETVISRGVTNTRMRDFYDIHILWQIYGKSLSEPMLRDAFAATAKKRGTFLQMQEAEGILEQVEESSVMEKLWQSYQRTYSYAASLSWHTVMDSVRVLYRIEKIQILTQGGKSMNTFFYEVAGLDGDYANLKRTDIESDELKLVARALLPPEITEGTKLKYEWMQYEIINE